MKTSNTNFIKFISVIILSIFCKVGFSQTTITSVASGNWSSTSTWSPAQVPTALDSVVIAGGFTVIVDAASSCKSIGFGLDSNNDSLYVATNNTLTISNILNITKNSTTNNKRHHVNVDGTLTASSIAIDGGSATNQRRAGLFIGAGTVNVSGNLYGPGVALPANDLKFTGAGTINVGGNFLFNTTAADRTANFTTFSGCTVNLNGTGSQAVWSTTFENLSTNKAGGTSTFSTLTTPVSSLIINGAFTNVSNSNVNIAGGGITVGGTGSFSSGTGQYIFATTATQTLNGVITLEKFTVSSPVTLTNNGTLTASLLTIINNGGTLNNAGTFNKTGGLTNNGTVTNTGTLNRTAGAYRGAGGVFNSSLFTNPTGIIVAPGATSTPPDYGCLTFSNGFTNNGILQIEIGGTTPCTQFDQINITGVATMGSSSVLNINFGAFTPTVGQTFQLVNATTYIGTVSNVIITPASIAATYNSSDGVLTVNAIGLPIITSFSPTNVYTGSTVTITGSNFTGATAVSLGATPVASYIIDNDNQITAIVGSGATGTVKVTNVNGLNNSVGVLTYLGYITNATGTWGAGASWLGGGIPPASADVTIAHDINLDINPTTVNNLIFQNGKVILGANDLALVGNISSANSTNYVVTNSTGALSLSNVGAAPVIFPVGPSTTLYHPATIKNTGTVDNFSVKVSSTPLACTNASYTVNATWNIAESIAGGSNCAIDFDYTAATGNGGSFDFTMAKIAHCNGSTPDYSSGTATATTASGTGFTSFSPFGISSDPLLPIKLISFTGKLTNLGAKLNWTTSFEQNNKGFEIQKSNDGINFKTIGFVNTLANGGNSTSNIDYTYLDDNATTGNNFYRLNQIDNNQISTLSEVVLVNVLPKNKVEISKVVVNQSKTIATVYINSPLKQQVQFALYDRIGKTLLTLNKQVQVGINNIEINITNLSNGVYLISGITASDKVTKVFVK